MIKKFCIAILVLFCSCKQNRSEQIVSITNYKFQQNWLENISSDTIDIYWKNILKKDSLDREFKNAFMNSLPMETKTIKVLWHEKESSIINEDYCKTISEPERAALGYAGMFYDSSSNYNKTISEFCTLESALDLDYHCSEKYQYYMRLWFKNDIESLRKINNCKDIYDSASLHHYFHEITLIVKENKIYIYFIGKGYSLDNWDCKWTGKFVFLVNKYAVKLIKREESKPKYKYYHSNQEELPFIHE